MQRNSYINKVISELLDRESPLVLSELERASSVLDQISDLPSPQKEEVFVRLVLERAFEAGSHDQLNRSYAA